MNFFSKLLRNLLQSVRQINIHSGNYIENLYGNYIQYFDSKSQKRDKIQKSLLDDVKHEIANRLKHSLHKRVSIIIDKEKDLNQVNPPWAIEVKIGLREPTPLAPETTIIDLYDRKDIKGRLLILGAPGSGKTTTLLQLAEVLANRALEDINQPIPVLFNLSSWKDDEQSIKDWIIENLKLIYGIRQEIGQGWIESADIIPLLDGLDELASDRQEKCVQKINQYLQAEGKLCPPIVCSRTEEYQLYQSRLGLSASIRLKPLSQEKIQDFILRTEGEQLWLNIKDDSNLMDLAKTILLLNVMVISCEEISFNNWKNLDSSQERLSYLFNAYISRMLKREYRGKKPDCEKTQQRLAWLAFQLNRNNKTEFFIENLSPSWLLNFKQVIIYENIISIFLVILIGGIYGIHGSLIFGLFYGLKKKFLAFDSIIFLYKKLIKIFRNTYFTSYSIYYNQKNINILPGTMADIFFRRNRPDNIMKWKLKKILVKKPNISNLNYSEVFGYFSRLEKANFSLTTYQQQDMLKILLTYTKIFLWGLIGGLFSLFLFGLKNNVLIFFPTFNNITWYLYIFISGFLGSILVINNSNLVKNIINIEKLNWSIILSFKRGAYTTKSGFTNAIKILLILLTLPVFFLSILILFFSQM